MSNTEVSILVVLILYMVSMLGVGAIFSRKKMSLNDYILGGRELNPWVSAMSTQASDMSGWLLTGIPGLAYACVNSAKEAIWTALGLLIGTLLNWLLVAKRLRVYSQVADNSLTIPSYFENRFKDKKGILRLVAAIVIFIFFTVYTASMFSAGAKLFSNIFPALSYRSALLIGALVIIIYTFLGGFLAVSWTDLFQGLLMFFALIIIPIVMCVKMPDGGMADVNLVFKNISNLFYEEADDLGRLQTFGLLGIISSLTWGLGYFGMPHILVRFMATRDKKTIRSATVIAMIWVVISMACALAIGVLARGFGDIHVDDNEQILIAVIGKLFHPILAGLLLSAVLAAIMSTADSQLLVAASAFSNDIYKRHLRKNASDKECLLVSRATIVVISAIAIIIALDEKSKIFTLVQYAWAGFGAAFGPVMIFSLYSKKITLKGAVASIITGTIVTMAFKYGFSRLGGVWAVYELLPGFIMSTAALLIVSAIDKNGVTEEMSSDFERMISIVKSKSDDLTLYDDAPAVAVETSGDAVVADAVAGAMVMSDSASESAPISAETDSAVTEDTSVEAGEETDADPVDENGGTESDSDIVE